MATKKQLPSKKNKIKSVNSTSSLVVIDALLCEKVDIIYGYPGGAILTNS